MSQKRLTMSQNRPTNEVICPFVFISISSYWSLARVYVGCLSWARRCDSFDIYLYTSMSLEYIFTHRYQMGHIARAIGSAVSLSLCNMGWLRLVGSK